MVFDVAEELLKPGQNEDLGTGAVEANEDARQGHVFPLSDMQQTYLAGRSALFDLHTKSHIYFEFDLTEVDVGRLGAAWRRLVARHDALRTVIHASGQQQTLTQTPPFTILSCDVTSVSGRATEEELARIRQTILTRAYEPHQWPLFDIRVTHIASNRHRLHFYFDLLIVDGLSVSIIFSEFERLYSDPMASLPHVRLSLGEVMRATESGKNGAVYEESRRYWLARIPSLPPMPELPLVRTPAGAAAGRFRRHRGCLSASEWRTLKITAAAIGLTPAMALCAAYAEIICLWSRRSHFLLNIMFSNRDRSFGHEADNLVGNFSSISLLEVNRTAAANFEERAKELRDQFFNDLDHRHFSGIEVLQEMNRLRGTTAQAAAPVVFSSNLHLRRSTLGPSVRLFEIYGDNTSYTQLETPQAWLDASVNEDENGALIFHWDALEDVFPEQLIDDMFEAYARLLSQLAHGELAWKAATPTVLPENQLGQRRQINMTSSTVPLCRLHDLFENQATAQPDHVAVSCGQTKLTYAELRLWSNHLGRALRLLGARPNQLIAVVMEKGWEQVAAVLGILASGAAYVPIDPGLPRERRFLLMQQCDISIALTTTSCDKNVEWPEGIERISVDTLRMSPQDAAPMDHAQRPEDLAYVIFTSGSTGVPKGVMIDHRGAVNTVVDINRRFRVSPDDRVLAVSALTFDLSVWDIFGALAAGATVVMPQAALAKDPSHWMAILQQDAVTIWNSAPPVMDLLLEYAEAGTIPLLPSLRLTMLSGDWIPVSMPSRIRNFGKGVEVVSLGGATEASIWSIVYPINEIAPDQKRIPYGKPLANQTFHVLDDQLHARPVWVSGELYIGGLGLAQGYWRDVDKTSARFLVHPQSGERLYRTGDIGRYLPDGNIEFLGREDNQVKVRGYRIELGEIEAVLRSHDKVAKSVVIVRNDAHERTIVAYAVIKHEMPGESSLVKEELLSFLRRKLPDYMVPSHIVVLEQLPLNASGKIDRKALPPVDASRTPQKRNGRSRARNDIEHQLIQIWQSVLGVQPIGVTDDFFSLGGQSFTAVRMMGKVREQLGHELPLSALLHSRTVEGLARLVAEKAADDSTLISPVVTIQPQGTGKPWFWVHPAGGNVLCYVELAEHLGANRPFCAFQAPPYQSHAPEQPLPDRVELMASAYLDALEANDPVGPYLLGGWSSGGVVAFEMARQLESRGKKVELLAMVDSPAPLQRELVPEEVMLAWFRRDLNAIANVVDADTYRSTETKGQINSTSSEQAQIDHAYEVFKANMRAVRHYLPNPVSCRVVLFRADGEPIEEFHDHPARSQRDWGWADYVSNDMRVILLPGDHYSLLAKPTVAKLAEGLHQLMAG